jgi:hypothetical protein
LDKLVASDWTRLSDHVAVPIELTRGLFHYCGYFFAQQDAPLIARSDYVLAGALTSLDSDQSPFPEFGQRALHRPIAHP